VRLEADANGRAHLEVDVVRAGEPRHDQLELEPKTA
jgi:hypothetical protein